MGERLRPNFKGTGTSGGYNNGKLKGVNILFKLISLYRQFLLKTLAAVLSYL